MANKPHNTAAQPQAAAIVQMPVDSMRRAATLAAGGVYQPPFPWDVPPPSHIARHIMGSIPAPNYGIANQVEILNYTVPAGMWFVIKALLIRYDGQNFNQGSGDIVFQVDVDNPQTFGVAGNLSTGRALQDYGKVLWNMGSFENGAVRIWGSPVFYANQRIGIKGYTVQNVATGAPNYFSAWMLGWEWTLAQ
jgi:hypothetical protein